jgi:hypothetical protein
MHRIPKIVTERLGTAGPARHHPDPDLLTAFVEQSLPTPERAIVVEHLAGCSNCREIVAFALPERQEVKVPANPASRGWFTWNALRWGFVTAGILIATFGVIQYRRYSRHSMLADKLPASPAIYKDAENKPLPTIPASKAAEPTRKAQKEPVPAANEERDQSATTQAAPIPAPPAEASKSTVLTASGSRNSRTAAHRASLYPGPRVMQQNQWQNATANQQQIAGTAPQSLVNEIHGNAVPASAESVAVTVKQDDQLKAQEQDALVALNSQKLDQQLPQGGQAEAEVERAKPATVVSGAAKVLRAAPSPLGVAGTLPSPKWTISSTGALQRSFDQGSTWQEVSVNGNTAPPGAASYSVAKVSQPTFVDKDQADKKKATPVVFRAVAANGADVWAGGSAGLLYHSTDAGSHWTRVVPTSKGVILVGDIVTVEFSDAQHGSVSTSTPEVWTTTDAGQTWQKQ